MYNAPQSTKEINKVEIYKTEAEIHQETRREIPTDNEHASEDKKNQSGEEKIKKSTIVGATFMLTNICLGTTIFTFAVRAKAFGLFWIIFFCLIVAAANYWTIMRGAYASSKTEEYDYSAIVEHFLGKKMRIVLNIFIILYSYACIMCFLALIFPLFGRFIQSAFYKDKYPNFEAFEDAKWGKAYIKFPFFVGMAFLLSLLCLIKDINKLNFSAYIGVGAVIYTLFVVAIQCHSYYNHYKQTIYIKEDKSTHPNWFNFGKAWTKDMDFFKGMANLFTAYACHPGIFPVYRGFKVYYENKGIREMKISTFLATLLTTALHIVSIVCSFLTDPYDPEDLVIYRKNKGNGKDIWMVIARCFIALSLFFTLPGYYFPLRLSISNMFCKGQISNIFNIIFTFISCFVCAAIAAVYDKILNYLSYIGGFISVFICYLIPVLTYLYSKNERLTEWHNLIEIIGVIILIAIGIIAGIATIIDDVKN